MKPKRRIEDELAEIEREIDDMRRERREEEQARKKTASPIMAGPLILPGEAD